VSKVDWLQGLVAVTSSGLDTLIGELSAVFKDTFADDQGYCFAGRAFEHHRVSDRGCRIAWNIKIPNDGDSDRHYLDEKIIDCWFMIPAKFLNGCDNTFQFRNFLCFLGDLGFKPSRIDLAIDDYTKSLAWQSFDDARKAGYARGFIKARLTSSFGDKLGDGFTYYMGSTGSDKLYRFYDKFVESNGEIDAYRLEGQYRDDWCKSIWALLVQSASDSDQDFHRTIVNCVCSPINFVDENDVPLQWWSDFKHSVKFEGINLTCGRVKTSIQKSIDWVEKSVETSLAMIEDFCDRTTTDFGEWLTKRLESGRSRLRSVHKNRVNSACKVLSEVSSGLNFYYEKFGEYPIGIDF
jgi:DNA relaxase NicK